MPRSIRLFFRNRWVDGIASASSTGSSDNTATYEVENTQKSALSLVWRSRRLSGSGEHYISCDLGTAYRIGAVCLVGTNLTIDATIRVRVGNTSDFSTTLYDSGFVGRNRYFSDAEIATARTSEFFLAGLPVVSTERRIQRQVIIVLLPAEVTAQYVRIDISDEGNPDGHIEVGYVYAGLVYEPSRDLLFDWQLQRDNVVRGGQAASGQYWSASVFHKTLIQFSLAPQTESEVLSAWILFEHLISINKECIVQLVDFTDSLRFTTTIYGRFTESITNTKIAFSSYGLSFAFEEIIA